jgi:hypothetical protein
VVSANLPGDDVARFRALLSLLLAGAPLGCRKASPDAPSATTTTTATTATASSSSAIAPARSAAPDAAPSARSTPLACGMPARLLARGWRTELTPTSATESPAFVPGTVTLVALPDTQYYTDCRSPHLAAQTRWIREQASARGVRAVVTLGDLTEHNVDAEWAFVRDGFGLVTNDVPVVLVTGNHDEGDGGSANRRGTLLGKYFPEPPGKAKLALAETLRPGDISNAYYRVTLPKVTLGFLALEWSPRDEAVRWANAALGRYPKDRVVIATHAYLYDDGTRYDWKGKGAAQEWNPLAYPTGKREQKKDAALDNLHRDGAHDGEMLWNALVKRHPGVFLVTSGHVLGKGEGVLTSTGDAGNRVQQVLVNYQMLREGGLGYLRLFEILPDGRTLRMKTYSPSLALYALGTAHAGDLALDPPLW